MHPKPHADLAGNAIGVGDYVAYAALWSRSATLMCCARYTCSDDRNVR